MLSHRGKSLNLDVLASSVKSAPVPNSTAFCAADIITLLAKSTHGIFRARTCMTLGLMPLVADSIALKSKSQVTSY